MEPHETVYKKYLLTYDIHSNKHSDVKEELKNYKNFHLQDSVFIIESVDTIDKLFTKFFSKIEEKQDKLYIVRVDSRDKEWVHHDPDKKIRENFKNFLTNFF